MFKRRNKAKAERKKEIFKKKVKEAKESKLEKARLILAQFNEDEQQEIQDKANRWLEYYTENVSKKMREIFNDIDILKFEEMVHERRIIARNNYIKGKTFYCEVEILKDDKLIDTLIIEMKEDTDEQE